MAPLFTPRRLPLNALQPSAGAGRRKKQERYKLELAKRVHEIRLLAQSPSQPGGGTNCVKPSLDGVRESDDPHALDNQRAGLDVGYGTADPNTSYYIRLKSRPRLRKLLRQRHPHPPGTYVRAPYRVQRGDGTPWKKLWHGQTLDLPSWFDRQRVDFTFEKYVVHQSYRPVFVDPAGSKPRDLRVRRFRPKSDEYDENGCRITRGQVLMRATYVCNTQHFAELPEIPHKPISPPEALCVDDDVFSDLSGPWRNAQNGSNQARTDEEILRAAAVSRQMQALALDRLKTQRQTVDALDSTDGDECDNRSTTSEGNAEPQAPTKHGRAACGVSIIIEVLYGDIGPQTCTIWQRGEHDDCVMDELLQMSRRVHEHIVDLAGTPSFVPRDVMRSLDKAFRERPDWSEESLPLRRRPDVNDVAYVIAAQKKGQALDRDPLIATQILRDRNPESFFVHQPMTATEPLMAGITSTNALDSAILHGFTNGIAMDSSWRHLNHNGLPLTFVITLNDHMHGVPVFAFLSQDIQSKTLSKFLRRGQYAVGRRAQEITEAVDRGDPIDIPGVRSDRDRATIIENARRIATSPKWVPAFAMVDKDLAEINALYEVFGTDFNIRLCQFHVMQAIRRWDMERSRKQGTPRLPEDAMKDLLQLFRQLQRCSSVEEWDADQEAFHSGLRQLCKTHGVPRRYTAVAKYFEENWFTEQWRKLWVDYRLPAGASRDGALNTNNFIESAFKAFKIVFLGGRQNKRIDRLLAILIVDYFPYYAIWPPTADRPCAELMSVAEDGYESWTQSLFTAEKFEDYTIWTISLLSDDERSSGDPGRAATIDVLIRSDGRRSCPCSKWRSTGKYCRHLWAMGWHEACGPYVLFTDRVAIDANRMEKQLLAYQSKKKPKPSRNAEVEQELLEGVLEDDDHVYGAPWKYTAGIGQDSKITASSSIIPDQSTFVPDQPCTPASPILQLVRKPRSLSMSLPYTPQGQGIALPMKSALQGRRAPLTPLQPKRGKKKPGRARPWFEPESDPEQQEDDQATDASESSRRRTQNPPEGSAVVDLTEGDPPSPKRQMQGRPAQPANAGSEPIAILARGLSYPLCFPPQVDHLTQFRNPSTACYMNAPFQLLFHLPVVLDNLLETDIGRRTRTLSIASEVVKCAKEWLRAKEPLELTLFSQVVGETKQNLFGFTIGTQECANELMDKLMTECGRQSVRPNPLGWLKDLFRWVQETDIRCLSCGASRSGPAQEATVLHLPVPATGGGHLTIQGLMEQYFAPKTVATDGLCSETEGCQGKSLTMVESFTGAPALLRLRLQRTDKSDFRNVLVQDVISVKSSSGDLPYRLVGIIQHQGLPKQGHYVADVLVGSEWKRLDDRNPSSTAASNPCRTWKARQALKDGGELLLSPSILVYQQTRPGSPSPPLRAKGAAKAKRDEIGDGTDIISVTISIQPKLKIPNDFDQQTWNMLPRMLPTVDVRCQELSEWYERLCDAATRKHKTFAAWELRPDIDGVGTGKGIQPASAHRFGPGVWASDEIVASWRALLRTRTSAGDTTLASWLFLKGVDTGRQRRKRNKYWRKLGRMFVGDDLLKRIVFPYLHGGHWALGVIDLDLRQVHLYDTMATLGFAKIFHKRVSRVLDYIWRDEHRRASPEGRRASEIEACPDFVHLPEEDHALYVPQQADGDACGFMTCRNMELAMMRQHPTQETCGTIGRNYSEHEGNLIRLVVAANLRSFAHEIEEDD